jgi:hypothetical protein
MYHSQFFALKIVDARMHAREWLRSTGGDPALQSLNLPCVALKEYVEDNKGRF